MFDIFRIRILTTLAVSLIATLSTASAQTLCPTDPTIDAGLIAGLTPRQVVGTALFPNCDPYFTVDVTVPGSYNGGNTKLIVIGAGFADSGSVLNAGNCQDASLSHVIHKRHSPTGLPGSFSAWKLVNLQNVKQGTWVPGVNYCAFAVPFDVVAPGDSFGLDEYLVQVLPKFFGIAVPAFVSWGPINIT
jgi:hypothetical protein